MKTIRLSLLVVALFTLSGCGAGNDSRPEMRARFSDQVRILVDEEGRSYIVTHNIGGNYFLSPYQPTKAAQPPK